ncbi:Mitogen-activated protein kinase kinase kinase 1 [Portunus trituberculatus]|uniref:Mitogen-activated protein kinase kinase kinase 1 n=1 Tax=Portunus trituberculatus TaxID=210409 RepID=A0A5B7EHS3_PORTR|nr:Mitogen-activated protein kinase kinase kinase 1 [Portunus trituberculatus]
MCMVEGESLVACEAGCRNQLHHHCMAVWAADRHAQGQPLLCPLCRAPWPLKHHPRLAPAPPTAMRPPPTTSAPAAPTQDFASVMSASFSGKGRGVSGARFVHEMRWCIQKPVGLHDMVVKVLHWDRLVTGEEKRQLVIHCCANILGQVANDPVYKVYLACLTCLRVLLAHLSPCSSTQVGELQELLRPLVYTLLLKCADGNRRTSQISVDSILELSRGQEGELALATQTACPTPGLGGISFVLSCILDDTPPSEAPWQWLLGRLCVLDRLLDKFPSEFQLQYMPLQAGVESGYKLEHYDRLVTVVEFAFKALGSSHATVSKLARRVYICGARFAAAEPAVFHQVCDMLTKLDVSLQARLKRRLQSMQGQHGDRKLSAARLEGKLSLGTWDLADGAGPRLVRSVSHSPSRMLSALRSSSQSPARQPLLSTSAKKEGAKVPPGPTPSPPRPTHLPLDCFEVNFKKKQAKLRLCQKMKKHDVPFMVHNVLVSPMQQQQHQRLSSAKMAGVLHKSGLSQSQGDALDMSPQTPIASVVPPKFSFKDVIASSNGPPPVPETLSAVTRDLALRCLEIKSENRPPAKELIHHQCFKTQPP